jgi:IS30 family transposase
MEKALEKALASITRNDIKVATDYFNHRPRKCLACKAPRELMMQQLLFHHKTGALLSWIRLML